MDFTSKFISMANVLLPFNSNALLPQLNDSQSRMVKEDDIRAKSLLEKREKALQKTLKR